MIILVTIYLVDLNFSYFITIQGTFLMVCMNLDGIIQCSLWWYIFFNFCLVFTLPRTYFISALNHWTSKDSQMFQLNSTLVSWKHINKFHDFNNKGGRYILITIFQKQWLIDTIPKTFSLFWFCKKNTVLTAWLGNLQHWRSCQYISGLSSLGVPWHPHILAHQLPLPQPRGGGQIIPPHHYWPPRVFRPSDGLAYAVIPLADGQLTLF